MRRASNAVAAIVALLLGGLPLFVEGQLPVLEVGLALAASLTVLQALIFSPRLLPAAVALYAAEFIALVHRRQLPVWTVPILAAGLLLLYETGELRFQLDHSWLIEAGPLRAAIRQVALVAGLGLLASATVVAAASLSSQGGLAAGLLGGLAATTVLLLIKILGRPPDRLR